MVSGAVDLELLERTGGVVEVVGIMMWFQEEDSDHVLVRLRVELKVGSQLSQVFLIVPEVCVVIAVEHRGQVLDGPVLLIVLHRPAGKELRASSELKVSFSDQLQLDFFLLVLV